MSPIGRYPGATWKPLARYQPGSTLHIAMTPRRLILHTAVSSASSMFGFFNVSGRASPHFYVNGTGQLEQYIDTDFRGTANLNGNHDCIGVESWDDAGKVTSWTDAQVEALAKLAAWCKDTHGIPIQRLTSSRPGTTGIGWHRLGIDGNFPDPPGRLLGGRVAGGETWTLSPGKICPFDGKIRGIVDRIIPRALQLTPGSSIPPADPNDTGVLDMDEKELTDLITKAVSAELDRPRYKDPDNPSKDRSVVGLLRDIDRNTGKKGVK